MSKSKKKYSVLILDIDGASNYEYPHLVLDKVQDLVKKDPYGKAIWDLFRASAEDLNVRPQALPYLSFKKIREHFDKIYILTARLESWRPSTEAWLEKWNFKVDKVFMRPDELYKLTGAEVKEKIVTEQILPFHSKDSCVACDDDDKICEMYDRLGIKYFKAPHGWVEFLLHIEEELKSIGDTL